MKREHPKYRHEGTSGVAFCFPDLCLVISGGHTIAVFRLKSLKK